jgi:hypothetical protein
MPTVQLTDPKSGDTKTVQLDGTPTQSDLEELSGKLFGGVPAPNPPPTPTPPTDQAVMDQFGRIAADFATSPLTGAIVAKQGESGQNLTTLPSPQGDVLARQLPGDGLQYRPPGGADPFSVPGSPVAQFEAQNGGAQARTVQGGVTRVAARNGQVGYFDAQGRPTGAPQAPIMAAPDYVGGVQQAIGNAGEAIGKGLSAINPFPAASPQWQKNLGPAGQVANRILQNAPKDVGGVVGGIPSFALGTAKAVGADVGAALAKDPALKAQAEQEADQFSKDFVGSVIGAPHLDPNDPNAQKGWAAQAYKAIGYLHSGDRASAMQAAQNVATAIGQGIEQHPVMTALGAAGGAAGLMGMRGRALETLAQAKDAAEAVGDKEAASGAEQASQHIAAQTAPEEPVAEAPAPAAETSSAATAKAQHPAWQAYEEALKPKPAAAPEAQPASASTAQPFTLETTPEGINAKTWYHGTGTANIKPEFLSSAGTNHENLMGQGVYLTDNPDIAKGYADARSKKTGTPVIYQASVDMKNVLNLEDKAPDDVRKLFASSYNTVGDEPAHNVLTALKNPDATPEDLLQAYRNDVREHSHAYGISTNEYVENFQELAGDLKKAGYDALTHTGGKRTGHDPHQVLIALDPNDFEENGRGKTITSFEPMKAPETAKTEEVAPESQPLTVNKVSTSVKPTLTTIPNAAAFKSAVQQHFGLSEPEADAAAKIADARAQAWAKANDKPASEWYQTRIADIAGQLPSESPKAEPEPVAVKEPETAAEAVPVKAAAPKAIAPVKMAAPAPQPETVKPTAPAKVVAPKPLTPEAAAVLPKAPVTPKAKGPAVAANTPDENGIVHGSPDIHSASRGGKTQVRAKINVGEPVTTEGSPAASTRYHVEATRENPRGSQAKPKAADPIWRVYDNRAKKFVGEPSTQAEALSQAKGLAVEAKKALFQREPEVYEKNLVALHNTSENGILAADRLGGIPAPAIAVTRRDLPFENFGDISLVGKRGMIDPETYPGHKIYGSDVYSPRQPKESYTVNEKALNDFVAKHVNPAIQAEGSKRNYYSWDQNSVYREDTKERLISDIARDAEVRAAFLKDQGKPVEIPTKEQYGQVGLDRWELRNRTDDALKAIPNHEEAVENWVRSHIENAFKGPFLEKGSRKVPYTLDNLVTAMTGKGIRGQEGGMFTNSLGAIRARGVKEFPNIATAHKAKESLVSKKDFQDYKDQTDAEWHEFQADVFNAHKDAQDRYGSMRVYDEAQEALSDYVKGPKTVTAFRNALRRWGFTGDIDDATVQKGMDVADRLLKSPTEYFEAKPKRAVRLNEFAGALVPKGVKSEVLQALKAHGLDVREYDPSTPGDRNAKLQELAGQHEGALFQGPKGSVQFLDDNRAIIRALNSPDVSTVVHELGHVFRRDLEGDDLKTVEDWAGVKNGQWEREHEEKFARGFERYLADGNAPTKALAGVFEKFKNWLTAIYKGITGSSIDVKVSPEVKAVMDRLLGGTGEAAKKAASERVGSINMRLFGGDKDAQAEIKEQYDRIIGLHHDKVTHEQIREFGKTLGLSYDDMRKMTPGDVPVTPEGVRPALFKAAYADAIRNLHAQAQRDLVDARAATRDARFDAQNDPTPESLKAEQDATVAQRQAQETAEMMHAHDSEASNVAGVTLSARNQQSEGFKGEGYRGALDVPTLDEALGLPKTGRVTKAMEEGPRTPDVPRPRGRAPGERGAKAPATPKPKPNSRPARVRTVKESDRLAAIAAYKASREPVSLPQKAESEEGVLHQREEADPKTEALVTLGKYHYENGLRDFSDLGANSKWQKAIEADTGDKLTPEQAQWVHQLTRDDLTKGVREQQVGTLQPLFVDRLSGELGRKGATQFLMDVGDDVRNRLIRGDAPESYTPEERQQIADAYDRNRPKPRTPPTRQAATVAKQIATDLRAPKARNAPPKTLDNILRARVKGGADSVAKIKADLASDALGQSALDKLQKGEGMTVAEERRLARAIDVYRRTTPKANPDALTRRITKLVSDARRGRLGYDSPLEAARTQMLADANRELEALPKSVNAAKRAKVEAAANAKARAIADDLAKITDEHDTQAIAKVMLKHSDLNKWNQVDQYVLGNVLSSPDTAVKIGVSHPATVAAEEMRRWLFGDRSEIPGGVRAGIQGVQARGVPEAKQILKEGATSANLAGTAWYKPLGGRIPVESKLALWRYLLRAHSAYYQLMQTYNVERGLHLAATEDGKAKGLTGQALADHVSDVLARPERYRALAEKAIKFGEEETQTSPNPVAKIMSQIAGQIPGGRIVKTTLLPVANLPLNALQRTLEAQTGLLTSRAMARMYARLHPDATPKEIKTYRDKVFQRGAVGAGIAGLSALLAAKGIITPSDPEHHRYTARINAFGHSFDVPAGSVGAVMDTGVSLEQDLKNRDFLRLPQQIAGPWVQDNPILRASETVTGAAGALNGNAQDQSAANRALGGVLSEYQPMSGATGFGAKAIDAARGQARKAPNLPFPLGALATPAGNVPGLRQRVYPVIKDKQGRTQPQALLHLQQAEPPGQLRRENAQNVREDRKALDKERAEWRKLEAALRRR